MTECHQRVERVKVALEAAEIRLERPEGQQNTPAQAILPLNPVEDRGKLLPLGTARIQTVG